MEGDEWLRPSVCIPSFRPGLFPSSYPRKCPPIYSILRLALGGEVQALIGPRLCPRGDGETSTWDIAPIIVAASRSEDSD